MKRIRSYLVCAFFLFAGGNATYAQSNNEIAVSYGWVVENGLFRFNKVRIDGDGSTTSKGAYLIGISYQRHLSASFSVKSGIEYASNRLMHHHAPMGTPDSPEPLYIELFSVPLQAQVHFAKYLFVNGGPYVDITINKSAYQTRDKQSGIGAGLGIGGRYGYRNLLFIVNPYVRQYAIVPFHKEPHHQRLTQAGVKFGIGYRF